MNRKWMAIVTLLVLMLSVCVFAAAEEPTDPVYPVPGPLEKHEHTVSVKIVDRGYTAHRLQEWCPACGRLLKERLEKHNFVDGVCTVCDWKCPHPPEAAEKHYERDGVKPQWDGNYIIGPGWEITECGVCRMELSRVETTVREFHNVHTHFTPVLECLPHDADTHALIRYCDECGTEVPEYVPHNCPPSDRPYTDEGDPDTHSRLVRCADCGFWVPQQQAHTWVHDSYRKDDTDGGEEGHIEVMKCSVCGAKKEVWQPHGAGTHVAYRQSGNDDTHIEVLQCALCGEFFEADRPHEFKHISYQNDGDTDTHLETVECTLCGQKTEKRVEHKLMHVCWKNISETQHAEVLRCNMCETEIQSAPCGHTFDAVTYGYLNSKNEKQHIRYTVCSLCGVKKDNGVSEPHEYTKIKLHGAEYTYCKKCCNSSDHMHYCRDRYPLCTYVVNDEVSHTVFKRCDICSQLFCATTAYHNIDRNTGRCACGYLADGCDHSFEYVEANALNGSYHEQIGVCEKCGKRITVTGLHNIQFLSETEFKSDGDQTHSRVHTDACTVCGYRIQETETLQHNMVLDFERYYCVDQFENHHHETYSYCTDCDYSIRMDINEGHHYVSAGQNGCFCDRCETYFEHDFELRREHDTNNMLCSDVYICRRCKYKLPPVKTEKFEKLNEKYTLKGSDYHTVTYNCSICDAYMVFTERHDFSRGVCVCGVFED